MVGMDVAIEREVDDARSIRDVETSGKRKRDQPCSSLGKRQRTSIPRVPQVQGQPGPMTCFYCHQPIAHGGKDPKVLSWHNPSYMVGQARTQFVPSHSGMDKWNRFQS